jgi:dihydropyrimidinase
MIFDKVIRNGTVVTAAAVFPADVGIRGERIAAVGLDLKGDMDLDASGCYVIPGGIDVHVHFQMSVGKYTSSDTFESGTIAAAHGGTTTVVDFVEPEGEESMLAALSSRRAEADPQVAIDYALHMTIPAWHADHALEEIPEVMAAGIYSFKMYQAYGPLCLDDDQLYRTLLALERFGGFPILHSENGPVIDRLRAEALSAGRIEPIWHARTRPVTLEGEATGRALELARQAGAPLFIVHVSCAETLERLVQARRRGQVAFGESCPQYLFLTEERLAEQGGERFICAPPLRTSADQEALWGGIVRDELQVISTDHCPFTLVEKASEPDFTRVPGGIPSVEARLSLVHDAARRGLISLTRWVETCCTAPARLFRLPRKGHIAPGYDADLVIFDPERVVQLSANVLHERVDWSPYEGKMVTGWPRIVLSRGEVIKREGGFSASSGRGRFLEAGRG